MRWNPRAKAALSGPIYTMNIELLTEFARSRSPIYKHGTPAGVQRLWLRAAGSGRKLRRFRPQNSVTTVTPGTSNLSIFTSASTDCSRVIVLPMSRSGFSFPASIIANNAL